jgi:hypothetical protein
MKFEIAIKGNKDQKENVSKYFLFISGISCNVIAAFHHDHLFVPLQQAEEAIRCLKQFQENLNQS